MEYIINIKAIGSLMYEMICTRPNICNFVEFVSRCLSNLEFLYWEKFSVTLKKWWIMYYAIKDQVCV
jgi:hypothetical protein